MAEEHEWVTILSHSVPGVVLCKPRQNGPPPTVINDDVTIDLDKIVWVECKPSMVGLGSPENEYYHVISRDEFRRTINTLQEKHNYQQAVEDVIGRVQTWKANGSGAPEAQRHEELLRDVCGIRKETRDTISDSDKIDPVTPLEKEFLRHLVEYSDKYLSYHHGNRITVYRGYGYGLATIGADLIENPDADGFRIKSTVVANFSLSEQAANNYGPLVLELTVDPLKIALATDHLLWHKHEGEAFTDAEVQIRGDKLDKAPRENLRASNTTRPILDLVQQLPHEDNIDFDKAVMNLDFSREDHEVIAAIVHELYNRDEKLYTDEAKQRVYNWYGIYSCQFAHGNYCGDEERSPESLAGAVKQISGDIPSLSHRGINRVL